MQNRATDAKTGGQKWVELNPSDEAGAGHGIPSAPETH